MAITSTFNILIAELINAILIAGAGIYVLLLPILFEVFIRKEESKSRLLFVLRDPSSGSVPFLFCAYAALS